MWVELCVYQAERKLIISKYHNSIPIYKQHEIQSSLVLTAVVPDHSLGVALGDRSMMAHGARAAIEQALAEIDGTP
jgi:hypothetical protein